MGSIFKEADMEEETSVLKSSNESLPRICGTITNLKDVLACSHRQAYVWLEDILRDMAGILRDNHTHSYTPIVAYAIHWKNGADIYGLTRGRDIKFSLCQEHGDKDCWKLERSEKDAFFRLPSQDSANTANNRSAVYLVPTTHKSPLCGKRTINN